MSKLVSLELSLKDLFILDHALNAYVDRECATDKDRFEENQLLDRINDGIKASKAGEKHAC